MIQDPKIRQAMRKIPGVPLVYVNKSVMILEPMAEATEQYRNREEKSKFKAGLKGGRVSNSGEKRKREDDTEEQGTESIGGKSTGDARPQKKKPKGAKGPNPLSVKKTKKPSQAEPSGEKAAKSKPAKTESQHTEDAVDATTTGEGEEAAKRKRKRKHKPKGDGGVSEGGVALEAEGETAES